MKNVTYNSHITFMLPMQHCFIMKSTTITLHQHTFVALQAFTHIHTHTMLTQNAAPSERLLFHRKAVQISSLLSHLKKQREYRMLQTTPFHIHRECVMSQTAGCKYYCTTAHSLDSVIQVCKLFSSA